jgi:hypothetical protein
VPTNPADDIGAYGCYSAFGPLLNGATSCFPPHYQQAGPGKPAAFAEIAALDNPVFLEWASVAPDVSYLTATLEDGAVLTLRPVKAEGARYVAIAVPRNVLRTVTAYSSTGEIGSNSPFSVPQGSPNGYYFGTWLAPGQRGFARSAPLIGSGRIEDGNWVARVYVGPWGGCYIVSMPGGSSQAYTHSPAILAQSVRTPAITTGGAASFGASQAVRWTAYDAAGHAVAHGTT